MFLLSPFYGIMTIEGSFFMGKINKYVGNTYGKLTVVDGGIRVERANGRLEFQQRCVCTCGEICYVRTSALTSGNTSSCGCQSSLVGKTIGMLTVLARDGKIATNGTQGYTCKCSCGTIVEREHGNLQQAIKNNIKANCGCYNKNKLSEISTTHGLSRENGKKTKLFMAWVSMKQRCYNTNNINYLDYGGRGITVCDEWLSDFKAFYDWSYSNGFIDGELLSIDRIDNDKGYFPDNCRWVSSKHQQRNRRTTTYLTYGNETKPLTQWAEELGLKPSTIRSRLRRGLNDEQALSLNMDYRNRKR